MNPTTTKPIFVLETELSCPDCKSRFPLEIQLSVRTAARVSAAYTKYLQEAEQEKKEKAAKPIADLAALQA